MLDGCIMRVRDMRRNSFESVGRILTRRINAGVHGVNGLRIILEILQGRFSGHIFCTFMVVVGHGGIEDLIQLLELQRHYGEDTSSESDPFPGA
jgi:hypothetical protein